MKHLRCRCLGGMTVTISTNTTIHHSTNTATADACILDFCTAITMQCFSYAIRSQSVLTTIQLGVSTMFSKYSPCILNTSEIASIACLHNFSGPALLSCSKILTYQLLGSQLWTALPLEKSRSPATVNKVSKRGITLEQSFTWNFR